MILAHNLVKVPSVIAKSMHSMNGWFFSYATATLDIYNMTLVVDENTVHRVSFSVSVSTTAKTRISFRDARQMPVIETAEVRSQLETM